MSRSLSSGRSFPGGALALVVVVFGLGCHGAKGTANDAHSARTPQPAQEEHPTSGLADPSAQPTKAEAPASTTNAQPTNAPPPAAPVTGTSSAPGSFKPSTNETPPAGIGGGPKSETGGAVFGDGNEGNTGAIKGGETPPPNDPKGK